MNAPYGAFGRVCMENINRLYGCSTCNTVYITTYCSNVRAADVCMCGMLCEGNWVDGMSHPSKHNAEP